MKINVEGTQNVLDACLENKIKNFIAISTAAVFGNQDIMPLNENSQTSPISPYGKSKLQMEKIIFDFSKKNNLNSIILRFFNLYGIGQSPEYSGVITKFLERITNNTHLQIYGTGSQTRDFIHIDDAVECINLAIKHLDGKIGKIYNIGTGNSISILHLAQLLLQISGKDLPIQFKPEIKGEILNSQTSINLVQEELGFQPKVFLKEGLTNLFYS
jgi:UDP-glucose 4-epimerase